MVTHVAVIDLGKTNSKVALVNTARAEETQVLTQPAAVNSDTIYPSLDCKSIENFIVESLRELGAGNPIHAITVTTHGATVALLDETGQLAMPVMDYEFSKIDELRNDYLKHRPAFTDTGSPSLPGGLNVGAQLYWQQTTHPALFSKVKTVLTWPQYWVYKLTGEKFNDFTSLGCHTDLYEPHQQRYSSLIESMHWQPLMPPTRRSGEHCGTLAPTVSALTRLPEQTPVYIGIHDSNASLVPHLLTQASPFTVVSTGTWFIAMAMGGTATPLDEARDTLLNINAKGEVVPSARFMGGRERELLGVTKPPTDTSMQQLLTNQATPPLLMPSVVPNTGPYPHSRTKWQNAPNDLQGQLRDCAVTLYLALMTFECIKLIGGNGPTYLEGPLAHDTHYAQMLASVSDRAVMISASQTGTSVGAAMLINSPDKQPDHKEIKLTPERRRQLSHYASLWKQHLNNHAR